MFGLILTLITVFSGIVTWFMQPVFGGPAETRTLPPAHLCSGYQSSVPAGAGDLWLPAGAVAERIKLMIHITAFNCVVLGTLLLAASEKLSFGTSAWVWIGAGVGFALAMFSFSCL